MKNKISGILLTAPLEVSKIVAEQVIAQLSRLPTKALVLAVFTSILLALSPRIIELFDNQFVRFIIFLLLIIAMAIFGYVFWKGDNALIKVAKELEAKLEDNSSILEDYKNTLNRIIDQQEMIEASVKNLNSLAQELNHLKDQPGLRDSVEELDNAIKLIYQEIDSMETVKKTMESAIYPLYRNPEQLKTIVNESKVIMSQVTSRKNLGQV